MPVPTLRPATWEDQDWLTELRAVVMRPDLERLGRFDETRVRDWLRRSYDPSLTEIVVLDGVDVGSIALRHEGDRVWLEHFYLEPAVQGRGVGSWVLSTVLPRVEGSVVRLNILRGSRVERLYERFGFAFADADGIEVYLERPASP